MLSEPEILALENDVADFGEPGEEGPSESSILPELEFAFKVKRVSDVVD